MQYFFVLSAVISVQINANTNTMIFKDALRQDVKQNLYAM